MHEGAGGGRLSGMPQPDFVPVKSSEAVRPDRELPVPDVWVPDRPAEIKTVFQPKGARLGNPGPDQGYALKLVKQFKGRLELAPGEHEADAIAGCLPVALKRAAHFGRAPVIHDFTHAFTLWGFLGGAAAEMVEWRKGLFEAASHHYEDQREIADLVPESTLVLTPEQVAASLTDWRALFDGVK